MKVPSVEQIREADNYTISYEPISSIDLMERASQVFVNWFSTKVIQNKRIIVCAGKGNNGGDGLAIARLLNKMQYDVSVIVLNYTDNASKGFSINFERIKKIKALSITELNSDSKPPDLSSFDVVIDALWGSGLSRPIDGFSGKFIDNINSTDTKVYSVDIPSGLHADKYINSIKVKADEMLSFEFPKFSFFMAENEVYIKNWDTRSIGILENHINEMNVANYYLDMPMIMSLIHERNTFSHKGDFGHACIISGHKGMMGAAILASRACLKAGVGLLSCYIPSCGYEVMQKSLPEAMVICDESDTHINSVSEKVYEFKTLGIGPGLGTNTQTEQTIIELLQRSKANMLIDADALNLLSKNTENYKYLNEKHILTPHPGEFKRLAGPWINDYEKIEKQRNFCIKYSCTMVLKGACTSICTPDGKIFFNSTGNPGMSTAGSGDVLSGLITGLLSQGYTCMESACLGVYIHGLAGDLAIEKESHESLIASDIIDYFGRAFKIVSKT